ncbi:MAG TPA: extracellular solute-binding protein [Anaerolineales bacterium]|nr:extracellular solute-binding protein [Anaerolineales bacterium]
MKKIPARQCIWSSLIVLLLLLLTSCSQSQQSPSPVDTAPPTSTPPHAPQPTRTQAPTATSTIEPSPTPSATQITATNLQGITITFWHPWSKNKEYATLALVNKFNASNEYGIMVTAFSQGSKTYQNVSSVLGSKDAPQVVVGYNNQIQSWDNQSGQVLDLNAYINDPEWGLSPEIQGDFYPIIWEQDTNGAGKRLGMPVYRSGTVIFYNQTWAQELGFNTPPTTPNELHEQACAAAEANNDSTGGLLITTDISTNMSWVMAFGGGFLNKSETGYQAVTPENEAAFTFLRTLLDEGCAWVPDAYYPNQEFATRRGLFYPSSIAGLPYQESAFTDANRFDQWTALPFPGVDGAPVINLYGPAYSILQSTPEQQLASWIFVKWLLQPENQAAFIKASGYFPVSVSALDALEEYAANNPRWSQAIEFIPYAQIEPAFGSWGVGRWAFGDAMEELLSPDFSSSQISALLANLEARLTEIHTEQP